MYVCLYSYVCMYTLCADKKWTPRTSVIASRNLMLANLNENSHSIDERMLNIHI